MRNTPKTNAYIVKFSQKVRSKFELLWMNINQHMFLSGPWDYKMFFSTRLLSFPEGFTLHPLQIISTLTRASKGTLNDIVLHIHNRAIRQKEDVFILI